MTKAKADAADAHMVAHQSEQAGSVEELDAKKEWSTTLGKKDAAGLPVGLPESMTREEREKLLRAKSGNIAPNYPSIEFQIVGRALTYDANGERKESYEEQIIFFRTSGNKDIPIVERYRAEKAYAVVAYHNFPPRAHPHYQEFAKLQQLLDGYINPIEARNARRNSGA